MSQGSSQIATRTLEDEALDRIAGGVEAVNPDTGERVNVDRAGKVVTRRQFHGKVIRASIADGVTLVDAAGCEHWLPLERDAYEPAEPGEYELRSTGEVVIDPTWLTRWTIYPPNIH